MVRVPRSWPPMAGLAGAQRYRGVSAQRIPRLPGEQYTRQVTVDLGNDGIAPQVTFTAAGTAEAFVGPGSGGDLWSLDQCSISTSVGPLDAAQCILYVGPLPLAQYQQAPSLSGGGQQFGMGGTSVPFGWFAWALWTGGTPGAFAYLRLTGTKTVLTN